MIEQKFEVMCVHCGETIEITRAGTQPCPLCNGSLYAYAIDDEDVYDYVLTVENGNDRR